MIKQVLEKRKEAAIQKLDQNIASYLKKQVEIEKAEIS